MIRVVPFSLTAQGIQDISLKSRKKKKSREDTMDLYGMLLRYKLKADT